MIRPYGIHARILSVRPAFAHALATIDSGFIHVNGQKPIIFYKFTIKNNSKDRLGVERSGAMMDIMVWPVMVEPKADDTTDTNFAG